MTLSRIPEWRAEQRELGQQLDDLDMLARPLRARRAEIEGLIESVARSGGHYTWRHCACHCRCDQKQIDRDNVEAAEAAGGG